MTDATNTAAVRRPRSRLTGQTCITTIVILIFAAALVVLAADGHGAVARWVLVVASTSLGAASAIPSIRAIHADPGSLRPVTWGIWAALTVLAALASARTGDWPSAIFSLVGTITCGTITIIVLRQGSHTATMLDAICLLAGIGGLVGWQTLHQPGLAVLAVCAGDLAALTPTIIHAWQQPGEEPALSFALIAAGGLCTAAAAWGHWTTTALAYPLYVTASTGLVALLTRRRPQPTGTDTSDNRVTEALR